MASQFTKLQDKVKARLEADAVFTTTPGNKPIPVYTEQIGELVKKLNIALSAGASGIAVIVLTPIAQMRNPKALALDLIAPVRVQIQENVFINSQSGSKVPALDVVAAVMRLLHHWPPGILFGPDENVRIELDEIPFVLVAEDPILTYDVMAAAPLNLSAPMKP